MRDDIQKLRKNLNKISFQNYIIKIEVINASQVGKFFTSRIKNRSIGLNLSARGYLSNISCLNMVSH